MNIKKSFLTVALASGLSIIGSTALTTTSSLSKNTNILPALQSKLNNGIFYMDSINDIGVLNEQLSRGIEIETLAFSGDIDLSGMTQAEIDSELSGYAGAIGEIDGQGYSIKNKPADLFFDPLISNVTSSTTTGGLYVHNLTLDNAPLLFEWVKTTAIVDSVSSDPEETGGGVTEDRVLDDSGATGSNSMYFQNISIINTNVESQDLDLVYQEDYGFAYSGAGYQGLNTNLTGYNFGLLTNGVMLDEGGGPQDDTVIRFNGLNLSNNKINNNTITFSSEVDTINFGLVSNFQYGVCGNSDHSHIGLISFNNVIIEENEFLGNEIVGASSDVVFSFSPLMSSFEFDGTNWVGSGGNFLKLNSIIIQNNSIEKPIGVSEGNFKYSDLVSQSLSTEESASLYTDIESFQQIISLNNDIYMDYDANDKYMNPTVVSIENIGSNSWTQEDADKLFFIGGSYQESSSLNLFIDESGNDAFNNIYHSETLNYKNDASTWNDMLLMLQRKVGIYGVSLEQDVNQNLDRISLSSSTSTSTEDKVSIIGVTARQNESQDIESVTINFNLLLSSTNNVDSSGGFISEPVTVSNAKILNEGNTLISTNGTYSALDPANLNYSFEIEFDLGSPLAEFNPADYPTLQMQFDYTDGVARFVRTTTVDLDPQELLDKWEAGLITSSDSGLKISAGVLGGIVGLILLILLILLLLFLYRRHQVAKVTEVQDGYYEFEDDNIGFDNNAQYDGQYGEYDDSYDAPEEYYEDSEDYGISSYDNEEEYYEQEEDYQGEYDDSYDNYDESFGDEY